MYMYYFVRPDKHANKLWNKKQQTQPSARYRAPNISLLSVVSYNLGKKHIANYITMSGYTPSNLFGPKNS